MPEYILTADHPTDPQAAVNLHIDAPDLATCYDLAFDLVTTYQLFGTFMPGDTVGGNLYLFTYRIGTAMALETIAAATIAEAEACLSALAESGTLAAVSG